MKAFLLFYFTFLCSCSLDMSKIDAIKDSEKITIKGFYNLQKPSYASPDANIKLVCAIKDEVASAYDFSVSKTEDITTKEWNEGKKYVNVVKNVGGSIYTCALAEVDKKGNTMNYYDLVSKTIKYSKAERYT